MALTLSAQYFVQDATPGTFIANIGNKTPGSSIELIGGNGRLTMNTDFTALYKGLIGPAAGPFDIILREIHPVLGTRDTPFTMTVTALAALAPTSASQPMAMATSLRKAVPAYAGNCLQVRPANNVGTLNVGFDGNGDINTATLAGAGDGVTYRMTIWYDQMGVTNRNWSTSTGPYLTFKNNFAILVTVPTPTAGGTGYTVGDVLTVSGGVLADVGGIASQLTVATVSSGVITSVTVSRAGKYRYSPSGTNNTAAAVTGGTGTGATFVLSLTPDVGNVYTPANCYIDYATTGGTSMATVDTFLNVGGTNNLAVFAVMSKLGYGSASTPLPRPGVSSTSSAVATLLGYGTLAAGKLLTSCSNLGNSQNDATSFSVNRDSLGRSVAPYDQPEHMALDESVPDAAGGFFNVWFNQTGATVTGGGDTRVHYYNREHGVAAATAQKVTLGAAGNLSLPHNGGVREILIFNPATPITDVEAQRIAIWQNQWSGVTQVTTWANRYFVIYTGQSNSNAHLSANTSGDNVAGTESANRRMRPKLAEIMGIATERILYGSAGITVVGGTAMMKRKMPGDPDNLAYWWDEDTNGPGSLMTSKQVVNPPSIGGGGVGTGYTVGDILTVTGGTLAPGGLATQFRVETLTGSAVLTVSVVRAGNYSTAPTAPMSVTGGTGTGATFSPNVIGGMLAYFDAIKFLKYKRCVIHHAQGEEDSTGNLDDARELAWAQQTFQFGAYIRTYLAQPEMPMVVQPLARYQSPNNPQRLRVVNMRRLQTSYLGAQYNVFVAPDTGFNARGTSANFEAHFGTMAVAANGGFDATTGTLEDGYQRVAWQNAKAIAHAFHIVQGKDLAANDNWRGPEIAEAKKTAANKVFYPVSFPYGCGANDISTVSGQYAGFRISVAGTDYFGTAHTKTTIGGKLGIEVTYAIADIPLGTQAFYEPIYSSGVAEGANVRNQLIDNTSDLNLPVASSLALSVAA